MSNDNLYIQIQPEMIEVFRKELRSGSSIYEIYAKYRNLSITEEHEGGDIDNITRYQFVCDLAKHMITEKAMKEQGYKKAGSLELWEKENPGL